MNQPSVLPINISKTVRSKLLARLITGVLLALAATLLGGWLVEPNANGVYSGSMSGAKGEVDILFEIKDRDGELSGEVRFDGSKPTKISGKRWKEIVSIEAAFTDGSSMTWYGRVSLANRRMGGTFTYTSASSGGVMDTGEWKVKRH